MIPKKIHFCWFGGKPLPKEVEKSINSWKKHCPDYQIIRWDESNFDVTSSLFLSTAYEQKAWAFVSDYARLKIVYDCGGIYLDTDVEIVKKIDELLKHDFFIGVQQSEQLCTTGLGFGAIKNNTIVAKMLKKYEYLKYDDNKKESIACPILNNKVFEELGYMTSNQIQTLNGATIYPPRYFDPYAPGKDLKNLFCEDTLLIHHYSASWLDKKSVVRRKIIRIIGQDRVSRIKRMLRHVK